MTKLACEYMKPKIYSTNVGCVNNRFWVTNLKLNIVYLIFIVPQIQNNTSHVNIALAHKLKFHKQNLLCYQLKCVYQS